VDLAPENRVAFVAGAAGGDEDVANETLRLLDLHDKAGDFLERPPCRLCPPDSDPLLGEGDLIADRFQIVALRGRGGMGEVYEALDRVLDERVALKVMRPGLSDPESVAARFRTEAQLARRISHPAVCRVHDVTFDHSSRHGDLIVLTMELLEGETLASRLAHGPMSIAEVSRLAEQMGAALDAAHAMRIVHGDIKPENVFLVTARDGPPRVVLTDFGLARALGGEFSSSASGTDPRFGTPAYMAPEQLRGESPSAGADLYALALVVLDMLIGRRRRGADPPAALEDTPRRWRRTLRRALDPDPDRRFRTAAEMMRTVSPWPIDRARRMAAHAKTPSGMVLAAMMVIAVTLFAARIRIYLRERPTVHPASELLVVDTGNETGNPLFDGTTELLRSQLSQSAHINLVSQDRVRATLRQMRQEAATPLTRAAAREVALRQGAALVLYSTIAHAGSGFALTVDLERVGPRPSLTRAQWTRQFGAASATDLFRAAHDATVWARQMTGEAPETLSDQDRPTSETTTSSWEALRLFTKANELQAQGRSGDAILLLDQALSLDPEFAMAQMRRADILIGVGRDVEGYAAWREAIRIGEKHQVTSREYLRIRAQYFEDAGEWVEAEKAYRTYVVHYPNDPDAAFLLGSVLRALGRTSEAVAWYERGARLRAGWFIPLVHLATAYLETGRDRDAIATISRLRAAGQPDYATWLEGLSALARGDALLALRAIEPLRASTDPVWVSRGFTLRASWLLELDRDAAGAPELGAGIDFDHAHGFQNAEADKWLHLAYLSRRRQEDDACASAARRALSAPPNASTVMRAGVVLAECGRATEAERLLRFFDSQPAVPRVNVARDRLESAIELAKGHIARAADLASRASAADSAYSPRLYLAEALSAAGDRTGAANAIAADVREPVRLYRSPDPPAPGVWRAVREFHDSLIVTRADARPRKEVP
jgi:tetratricopeptide (TPR) repeat protein/tRNA A-37 threonylcarbamoyl transferase component Bud32